MSSIQYVTPKVASQILGVHLMTLRNWAEKKQIETIRTPGGKRLFNVNSYIQKNNLQIENSNVSVVENETKKENIKRNICYCRVSSKNQEDDLSRQVNYMKEKYPSYEIVSEVGSGLNFKRPKLMKIIKDAIDGNIETLVVAHKDRLARFGFELIENIVKDYSNGKIIVINNVKMSPEDEITRDLISIINVFSARVNGLRKYKKEIKSNK